MRLLDHSEESFQAAQLDLVRIFKVIFMRKRARKVKCLKETGKIYVLFLSSPNAVMGLVTKASWGERHNKGKLEFALYIGISMEMQSG